MLSLEELESRALLSITGPFQAAAAPAGVSSLSSSAITAQAQTAAITSVHDGLWSNPATWSGGRVPGASDDVVIVNNVTIDHAQAHELDINAGTTTLAGDLQAYASVIVRGKLVGTQGGIYFHVANDRLFTGDATPGPDSTMPDFHSADTGLWVLKGATIDLEGPTVTSWLNAASSGASQSLGNGVSQQSSFNATSATLQSAPVGWQVGDTLLLVNEHGQSVLADLVSVSGATIQYHQHKVQPTDPDLVGHTLTDSNSNLTVSSVIANMTRRIQIVGADVHEGDTNHRAHTSYLYGASARLVNVEFRDLGARGMSGDYPVYFDQGGASSDVLTGSSIWQDVTDPGNRFVDVHAMQGVTIANNVAFRSQGNGFYFADSAAVGNTISGNLSVQVTDGEELPVNSDATTESNHFWLRAGNTISGNVAAGGGASGLIVLTGNSTATTTVANFTSLGTGLFGMWTATPNVTFTNPVAVYDFGAGFASDPAWDVDAHGAVLNNPLFVFNGTNDSAYGSQIFLNDSPVVTVNGGVLAGVKAFHTHYHSAFVATNTKIDVGTFMTPTYWEQAATLNQVTIHAALLFERAYPSPRYTSPGVVSFVSTSVQIGTAAPEVETADYIGNTFQNYPALQGDPIPNAIELDQPAPASGFIRVTMLPDDERWMTNIARWTVTPIGQTPTATSFIYQRQTAWTTLSALGGYPDGFPPGQYAVSLYTDSGQLLQTGFATVVSGQVSDLTLSVANNNPPVVTTSAGLLGARAGGGAVVVDGGLTVSDDGTTLAGATVTIQSPAYVAGRESLGFTNRPGIAGSFNSTTGVLTLTGSGSLTDYQAALRSVTYVNTAPTAFNGQRTISFVVNDGTQASNAATRQIALYVPGDMNRDGVFNNFDMSLFQLALLNPSTFVAQNPTVTDYLFRGDINHDGAFNNFDLSPFETLLTSSQASSTTTVHATTAAFAPAVGSAAVVSASVASAGVSASSPTVPLSPLNSAMAIVDASIATAVDSESDLSFGDQPIRLIRNRMFKKIANA